MNRWDKFATTVEEGPAPATWTFHLKGVLTSCPEAYAFLDDLRDRAHARPGPIILDLSGVDRITSAGVGVVAACHTSAVNAGGKVLLVCLGPQVRTVLDVVRLLTVIEHHTNQTEALQAIC